MTSSDLARAVAAGDAGALPPDELAAWVSAQRWFSSKLRDVAEFNVLDLIVLRQADPVVAIVIAEARFGAGTHELYQVPIAVRPRSDGWDAGVICSTAEHVAYDALIDEAADAALAAQFGHAATIERPAGCVRFHWDGAVAAPSERPPMRAIGAEQSNTSVVLDERLVLKVFRRVEPGVNPELEMLRFLAAHQFTNIATLAGWYSYTGELMDATLGIMQRFVPDARDGWELALDSLAAGDRSFLGRLRELGSVTGRMHAVLASDHGDPDFAPEEPAEESVSLLAATVDEQIERVFLDLPDGDPALAPIAGRGEEIRDHLSSLSHNGGVGGRLIRMHGDYHLGQTVHGPDEWVVLDFEGEPGRPLVERRRIRAPPRAVRVEAPLEHRARDVQRPGHDLVRCRANVDDSCTVLRGCPRRTGCEALDLRAGRFEQVVEGAPRHQSDRLELLERLAAALAPADRAARRRAEDVLEPRLGRAAVRAAERLRLELHERRRPGAARRGRREAGFAQLLAAGDGDAVGRPGVVLDHANLRLCAERRDLVLQRALHHLERRAAEERRRELDANAIAVDGDVADHAEIDQRDHGNLGVGDLVERGPDRLGRYHCAPGIERRTSVISSQSSASAGVCLPRSLAGTTSRPTRRASSSRSSGSSTPSA